jgi:hypothetical protein
MDLALEDVEGGGEQIYLPVIDCSLLEVFVFSGHLLRFLLLYPIFPRWTYLWSFGCDARGCF